MNKKSLAVVLAMVVVSIGLMVAFHGRRELTVAKTPVRQAAAPVSLAVQSQPKGAVTALTALPTNQTATVRGTKPFVLESECPIGKSLRLAAEAHGARTVGVLSSTQLLVEADAAARTRLAADRRFSSVTEFLPADKISARLAAAIEAGAQTVQVAFVLLSAEDRLRVQNEVVAEGGEILTGCRNSGDSFRAKVSADLVAEFATHGDVQWLEPFERPHLMNDLAVEPAAMNVRAIWDLQGLSGAGQIVTTSDSGIDTGDLATLHEDLRDRVVGIKVVDGCSSKDANGHGTHTAGSIVGNGSNSLERAEGPIRGTAWGAQLYAWFCGVGSGSGIRTPSSTAELFRPEQDKFPAFIHSASWGTNVAGEYDSECHAIDDYIWKNADFLPVFAAGNEGDRGAMTIGSPAASKNVLTVGATQNVREGSFPKGSPSAIPSGNPKLTAGYSSRGPCQDGRIKPDIAAPGSGILSTRARGVDYTYGVYDDNYAYDCGTSMACPLTAGSVALVREWLVTRRDFTNEPPTAALMKAVITGGAKDALVPGNDQGWGRVDLEETLFPSNRAVKLVDRIPFAENEEFVWVVETTNAAPLDVQLVWIDRPGAFSGSQSSPRLVNDLNLTVQRLEGDDTAVLYGNGGDSADDLNTVESVRIAAAEPNKYLISVDCKNIPYDCTDGGAAALYIRGAFDPEASEIKYGRVRIRESGELYLSLDKALEAVQAGETVEILEQVRLRRSVTVTNAVTIVATNGNPAASTVVPQAGATLTLAEGADLFVTNVVFQHDERLLVEAETGSVLRVAGRADLGQIRLATADNLCLAGALSSPILVDAPFATAAGAVFGSAANVTPEAAETANYLLDKYDEENGGECFFDGYGYRLRWLAGAPVPDAAAAARIEPEHAVYTNYRSLAVLFKYNASGCAAVMKSTRLTNHLELAASALVLRGEGDGLVLSPTDEAGFVVGKGASLTLTNLIVRGGNSLRSCPFVYVQGGSFTLEKNASLQNLNSGGYMSGAIALEPGTVTTRPDSSIRSCANGGDDPEIAGGGAIWMYGPGCVLNLEGGRITQCSANNWGGAVFACDSGAEVNLSGPLWVCDNASGNGDWYDVDDDLCLGYSSVTLKGNLTGGYVGLSYAYASPSPGDAFAAVASELQGQVTDFTRACFLCEVPMRDESDPDLAAATNGQWLVWDEAEHAARTEPDPERDVARIVRDDATTNYYYFIDGPGGAFDDLDRDGLVIELLQPCDFVASIPVERPVTVRLAYERDAGYDIYREADCGFVIGKGGDLTLDAVHVSGSGADGKSGQDVSSTLFHVAGGSLLLTNDTVLAEVVGTGMVDASDEKRGRAAGAVAVSNGGTFTMTEGSSINTCRNKYQDNVEETGVGAGLLVDDGTAYLRGGEIRWNRASRAAGVDVGNSGKVYVSGEMVITGNKVLDGKAASDLVVEGRGVLFLDGDLTGWSQIGYQEGVAGDGIDTNVFARVSPKALKACGGVAGATNYVTSAARFFRDDAQLITGRVVTNATEALLVWSYAVSGGVYTNDAGRVYGAVDAAHVDVPSAVQGLVYTGFAQTGVVAVVDAYVLTGNVATNVGSYTAVAELKPGYLWRDGSALPKQIDWSIAEAPGPGPGPGPETETTNYPNPIAFQSIERLSETEWRLVVTNRVPWCRYRLLHTDDLTKGFNETNEWEQATGSAPAAWTNDIPTSGGQYFWKAEGTWGIVPKDE